MYYNLQSFFYKLANRRNEIMNMVSRAQDGHLTMFIIFISSSVMHTVLPSFLSVNINL